MNTLQPEGAQVVERPPLPTRETIADGVMLQSDDPFWLKKASKYQLYVAVEQYIQQGYTPDDVLHAYLV